MNFLQYCTKYNEIILNIYILIGTTVYIIISKYQIVSHIKMAKEINKYLFGLMFLEILKNELSKM